MTTPRTDREWTSLIQAIQTSVQAHGAAPSAPLSASAGDAHSLARTIDHTLLKLDATEQQIDSLCDEAKQYGFKTVCVRLPWVARARSYLKDTQTGVCCVVGFHEGTYPTAAKVNETQAAFAAGATELDFVINHPLLHGSAPSYASIAAELSTLSALVPADVTSKLIIEISALSDAEVIAACTLAYLADFDFVKTSTGFAGHGAKIEAVELMRKTCDVLEDRYGAERTRSARCKVKASGGVRTWEDAKEMLAQGAERLGVSAGVAIVEGVGKGGKGDGAGY